MEIFIQFPIKNFRFLVLIKKCIKMIFIEYETVLCWHFVMGCCYSQSNNQQSSISNKNSHITISFMVKILLSILPKTDVIILFIFIFLPRLSTHNISITQHRTNMVFVTNRKKLILIVIIEMIT